MFKHKEKQNWWDIITNFSCNFIWCCFGICSITLAISSVYSINIDGSTILYGFVAVAGFMFIAHSLKTIPLGISIVVILFYKIYIKYDGFFPKVTLGFRIVGTNFIDRLNDIGYKVDYDFGITEQYFKMDKQGLDSYSQVAIIVVIFFLAVIIAIYAYKKHRPLLVSSIVILILLPGIMFEFMPSVSAFRFILSFLISLFAVRILDKINGKTYKPKRIKNLDLKNKLESELVVSLKQSFLNISCSGKYIITVFIISYIISVLSTFIPEKTIDVSFINDINSIFSESNYTLPFNIGFKGVISNGSLGRGGYVYSDLPIMEVYSNSNNPIYLRTWVGKNYDNNKWFSFDSAELDKYLYHFGDDFMPEQITWNFFETLSKIDIFKDIVDNSISLISANIKYLNVNSNHLYIPNIGINVQPYFYNGYFKNKGEGMAVIDSKFYLKEGYSINSIMPIYSLENIKTLIENSEQIYERNEFEDKKEIEQAYREFVYSEYVYLPSSIYKHISDLALAITAKDSTNFEKVISVQNYLSQNYTYNLKPPINTTDKDFVEYFLFDSKEGYCTYYATAMVLMLRTLGIPARYVEGYLVQGEGIKYEENYKRVVLDSNAHAWPEVYFDRVGWLPFEPTIAFTSELFEENDYSENSSSNFSDYRQEVYLKENDDITTEIETPNPLPDEYEQKSEVDTIQANTDNKNLTLYWISGLGLIFLLVAYRFIWSIYVKNRKKSKSAEEVIKYIFRILEHMNLICNKGELPTGFALRVDDKMSKRAGINFVDITDIILKARFSKLSILPEEVDSLTIYAEALLKVLYSEVNIFKRLYYKCILFV